MKNKLKLLYRRIRSFIRNIGYKLKYVDYTFDIQKPISISKDLRMGKYGFIGSDAWICPNVVLGNYVIIAPQLAILGGDHIYDKPTIPIIFSGRPETKKTVIEDDVWIGYRVIINAGVSIGKGSVVASGSIVTKNIPPYTIVGGNPAKVIRLRFSKAEQLAHDKMLANIPASSGVYNQLKKLY